MRVAVLDDWQGMADKLVDWSALRARAEVVFFQQRTPLPADVLHALAALRLLTFTGARNAAVDIAAASR
jgi:hypothetical protein